MFGHDDQQDENATTVNPTTDDVVTSDAPAVTPTEDPTVATDSTASNDSVEPAEASTGAPAVDYSTDSPASDSPSITDDVAAPTSSDIGDSTPTATPKPEPEAEAKPADEPAVTGSFGTLSGSDDDLLDLKKEALGELAPLVDQLDQSPEEKFNTTMMMIQATDTPGLIKTAHEAAQNIRDEKVRAQALLDIVNEINYFTQKDKTA